MGAAVREQWLAYACLLSLVIFVILPVVVLIIWRGTKQVSQYQNALEQNERSLALSEQMVKLLESIDRKLDSRP